MKKGKRKKNMQSITVMLFVATLLLWVALLFLKALIWGVDGPSVVDDIISNILGILPPMIIFNFLYEYLTKEHMADEMTEQITDTIMGSSEVLNAFDNHQKTCFIHNTVSSIVGEESSEMVNAVIDPYINNLYNIRTFYKYSVTLRDYTNGEMFSNGNYIKVYEDFKFRKKYLNGKLDNIFHIAFITRNGELDIALRNQTYIFQENFSVCQNELEALIGMSSSELLDFIKNEMQVSVYVDTKQTKITGASASDSGIDIEFESEHDSEQMEHSVEISFAMPQRKGHGEFFISISEPTNSPIIQLSYPETKMRVTAFSFLNDGDDSSVENSSHNLGNYEFCVQDKWIYPMSGVVFIIDDDIE